MALHIIGVAIVMFTVVPARRFLKRSKYPLSLAILLLIGYYGWVTTSADDNLYRLLKISRRHSVKDIQNGLDRLENSMDEETIADLERKLTGNTSAYYFKGRQLFIRT